MRTPAGRNIGSALAVAALAGIAILLCAGVTLVNADPGGLWSRLPEGQAVPGTSTKAARTATVQSELGRPTLPPTWTPSASPTEGPTLTPSATPTITATPTSTSTRVPPPTATPTELPRCPTTSYASFDIVPIVGSPADRPGHLHPNLNLGLRGYVKTSEERGLVHYNGPFDSDAPRLSGLFEPNRLPVIRNVYQVNGWIYEPEACDGNEGGCRGPVEDSYPVTMVGFATTPGEPIRIPERRQQMFPGNNKAFVLYAAEKRITLVYTREDTVAYGYAIYIENVCVDPALLAVYETQTNAEGWHSTGYLPVLRNDQTLGTAYGYEIQVAIRDSGAFMDPRSDKDWWQDQ